MDNKNQQFIRYNKQIKFDVNLELSEKNSSSKKNKTNSKSKNKLANGKNPIFIIRKSPNKKNKSYYFQSKKRKRSFKNNKLVFIQLDQGIENTKENIKNNCLEEKELSDQKKLLKLQKDIELIHTNTKSRRSKYRGVSKNGSQWQVLIMIKKKKKYMGSYSNEEEAARVYDKYALIYHGKKAKTNYDYTEEEVKKIIQLTK